MVFGGPLLIALAAALDTQSATVGADLRLQLVAEVWHEPHLGAARIDAAATRLTVYGMLHHLAATGVDNICCAHAIDDAAAAGAISLSTMVLMRASELDAALPLDHSVQSEHRLAHR